jgi:phosphoenolpyruvate carboxylase
MKLKLSFSHSTDRTVSDDSESIQEQLAAAQKEAQNAMGEFRSWGTRYYELAWLEAVEKVKRLEAKIPKKRARSA